MGEPRDSDWYRAEAERARRKADETTDLPLRDDFLKLAAAYDGLAEMLGRVSYHPEPHS